ncbi:MAG: hypothetical protein PHU25_13100 [Deltaproteobacteria bacterium]|nr:hypothetical protein [Deltaproteobacteria bacterium]
MSNVIRPTVTQRVRGFLAGQGVEVRPWAPLDETYASLYRLMSAKRDDAAFWGPVQGLLGEIVEDATGANGRLPAPQAELLKGWDIEELVRDLRRALPNEAVSDPSAFKRFSAGLSAPVLGGFLLFGVAATGCNESKGDDDTATDTGDAGGDTDTDTDSDTDADGDADSDTSTDSMTSTSPDTGSDTGTDTGDAGNADGGTDTSWDDGCALDSSSALWKTIDGAKSLSDEQKASLCACMSALQPDWQQDLSNVFEVCDPDIVALVLETLVDECAKNGGSLSDNPWSLALSYCEPTTDTAYKGVAFPEDWER